LTAIIKTQLAREDQAALQAVTVDVGDDGVVKLKGTVSSVEKKAKAEEIARRRRAKSVVNNLEVKP
jgi:osmotically-inducible protein OsmY